MEKNSSSSLPSSADDAAELFLPFVHTVRFSPPIARSDQPHLNGNELVGFWMLCNKKSDTLNFKTIKNKEVVEVEVKYFGENKTLPTSRVEVMSRKFLAQISERPFEEVDSKSNTRILFLPILSRNEKPSWEESLQSVNIFDNLFESSPATDLIDKILASNGFSVSQWRAEISAKSAAGLKVAADLRKALVGRLLVTKDHFGPLTEVDFMRTPKDSLPLRKKQTTRLTFAEHYAKTGRPLKRLDDPLLIFTTRPLSPALTLERQMNNREEAVAQLNDRLVLMPELCLLFGLTWDMAAYGSTLPFVATVVRRNFVADAAAVVLGHQWKNKKLLKQALTHPSTCHHFENSVLTSYERLEHLGDSVLGFIVAKKAYRLFRVREGVLTLIRLVSSNEALVPLMKYTGLAHLAHTEDERGNQKHLADTYEAIVGALCLDGGLEVAEKFVEDSLFRHVPDIVKKALGGSLQHEVEFSSWNLGKAHWDVQEAMAEMWNDPDEFLLSLYPPKPSPAELDHLIPLESLIGVEFKNKGLLLQALTHPTFYPREIRLSSPTYQRMEFLGDAILTYVVSLHLYHEFPTASEAVLSLMRQKIVRNAELTPISKRLGLANYLRVDMEEMHDKVYADLVEALVGAIFLDRGLTSASTFIHRMLISTSNLKPEDLKMDPKSALMHLLQESSMPFPIYEILSKVRMGKNDYTYEVALKLNGEILARAQGSTIAEADQIVSKLGMEKLLQEERIHVFGDSSLQPWPFAKKDSASK